MKKFRKILAICGIIFLLGLYVLTFIAACLHTEYSANLFMASLYSTFVIPIMIYALLLIYRVLKGKGVDELPEDQNDSNHSTKYKK